MKVRPWISLLAVSLVAAAALAVLLQPWNIGPTAANPGFGTFIDANTGDGTCDLPPDSANTVAHPANFNVAVCVEDPTAALGSFSFEVVYDDSVILAPEVANSGTALDDNPNANQAALGTGWDCSGFGLAYPTGDTDPAGGAGHGRAKINCLSLSGPWTFATTGSIALVNFNTQGIQNTTSLALENTVLGDGPGNEIGSCNPSVSVAMPCVGGSITVTGGQPTATSTSTPTATRTPTVTPTGTVTPTPLPYACRWEDDFGRNTSLVIHADQPGSWAFEGPGLIVSGASSRHLGTSRFVLGRTNGVMVFGMGRCPNGPGRATVLNLSVFPPQMFRLNDVSP